MGWTETHWQRGTKVENFFKEAFEQDNEKRTVIVLDAALVARTEAYAAVEVVNKETGEKKVFAAVYLFRFCNSGYYNFAYKDMDETSGPCVVRCPLRIMKLLTPTDSEWALEWRKRVYAYHEERKAGKERRKKFKEGDTVVFTETVRFTNGASFKSLKVLSTKPLRFTDGVVNIFGYPASYRLSKRLLDHMVAEVIPASQHGDIERIIPDIKKEDLSQYPKFHDPSMKEYICILWGQGANGWEWYGFEVEDYKSDKIYFGYVMGFENEWGSFSLQELLNAGVNVVTDPKELQALAPPIGWQKVA